MPNYLLQNPDDARARLIYANQLGRAGQKDEAIRESTNALVLSPGDPMMLYNAGCMYVSLGETSRAIDALRQAVECRLYDVRLDAERSGPDSVARPSQIRRTTAVDAVAVAA